MVAHANQFGFACQADYFAAECWNHGLPMPRAAVAAILEDIAQTFAGARFEPLQLFCAGEWVMLRAHFRGTHAGTARHPLVHGGLLTGVAPTNRKICVQHIHLFRVVNGEIIEHCAERDDLGMLRQLGLAGAGPATR